MGKSSNDMLADFLKDGWELVTGSGGVKRKGGHAKVRKGSLTAIIPMHRRELKKGTEKALIKMLNKGRSKK